MTEITQAEWARRVKALREAQAACVLPVGTLVQIRSSLGVVALRGVVKDAGTVDVAVQCDGESRLTVCDFDGIEIIDEPKPPETSKWLRPGMLVVVPGDGAWSGTVVGNPLGDGNVAVALHYTGATVKYDAAHLKPYVPQFKPGDRVVLATTGETLRVVEPVSKDRGTVYVRWSDRSFNRTVSAHLLTKIGEQDD